MRKLLVLVACAAVLGGACKTNDNKKSDATGVGIRDKALVAAEMPSGYQRADIDIDKRESDPIGCEQLDRVDEQYLPSTEHTADVRFQNGEDDDATQFVQQLVYDFKTVKDADTYFDAETAGLNACKTFASTEDDGSQNTGTIATYAFAKIADETTAATVTINNASEDGTFTLSGPVVVVRKGRSVLTVVAFHFGDEPGLSAGEVEALVRKAADKL